MPTSIVFIEQNQRTEGGVAAILNEDPALLSVLVMALRQLSLLLGTRSGSVATRCVRYRALSLSPALSHERLREVLPPLESFAKRHVGPSQEDINHMLKVVGVKVSKHNLMLLN